MKKFVMDKMLNLFTFGDICVMELDENVDSGETYVSQAMIEVGNGRDDEMRIQAIDGGSRGIARFMDLEVLQNLMSEGKRIECFWETSEDVEESIGNLGVSGGVVYYPTGLFDVVNEAMLGLSRVPLSDLNYVGCAFVVGGRPIRVRYWVEMEEVSDVKGFEKYNFTMKCVVERIGGEVFRIDGVMEPVEYPVTN